MKSQEEKAVDTALSLSIGSLCSRPAVYANPDDPLRVVARTLASELIGVAVVGSPQRLMGVLSERDVVRALADGADPDIERARDVMTEDVLRVPPETTVLEVARLMRRHDIRHVVVGGDDARPHIVSARDVLAALIDE